MAAKKGGKETIGRIHNAHPREGERFYLRLLLHVVTADDIALNDVQDKTDAFTFEAIKYVDSVKHETYKAAAMARNMLQDDGEWRLAMEDGAGVLSAHQLRNLYLFIVDNNEPENPAGLFEEFWGIKWWTIMRNY